MHGPCALERDKWVGGTLILVVEKVAIDCMVYHKTHSSEPSRVGPIFTGRSSNSMMFHGLGTLAPHDLVGT